MRIQMTLVCILLFPGAILAQEITPSVMSAAGNNSQSGDVTLEWTLGEIAIQNYTSSGPSISEGFHHGDAITMTSVYDGALGFQVSIYPNPASSTLFLEQREARMLTLTIYDMKGRAHLSRRITDYITSIIVTDLANGPYLLQIRDRETGATGSYRFIKQ